LLEIRMLTFRNRELTPSSLMPTLLMIRRSFAWRLLLPSAYRHQTHGRTAEHKWHAEAEAEAVICDFFQCIAGCVADTFGHGVIS
jgi:hypothetical protein